MIFFKFCQLPLLLLSVGVLGAAEIRNAGILGNSGEQGPTLVRFGTEHAMGLGAYYDSEGTLWDRAGYGMLNRYALDGRLLGTWKIPHSRPSHLRDSLVVMDGTFLFKQQEHLYTLPVNAPAGTEAKQLPVKANLLSTNTHDGWAAAVHEKEVFLVNLAGERKPLYTHAGNVWSVEIGPEGGVYISAQLPSQNNQMVLRVDAAAPPDARGPWPSPGAKMQWLNGYWFANADHGTLRRFSREFTTAPGVVLGGNSGSFIGYVPGNYELTEGNGLTHLEGNLYVVSGYRGVLHLLEWKPLDQRFEIIRRIGAAAECEALALDQEGRIWFHSGVWAWDDGPDSPLQHGVPTPKDPGILTAMVDDTGTMYAAAFAHGKSVFYNGTLDGPVRRNDAGNTLPEDMTAATMVKVNGKRRFLAVNAQGKGSHVTLHLGSNSQKSVAEPVQLQGSTAFQAVTTLSADTREERLVAGADGHVVEFAPAGDHDWKETKRWNSWGSAPDQHFGSRIHLARGGDRLWVSDTEHHRVLCFTLGGEQPVLLASFGTQNQSGDDLKSLNQPRAIATNGDRAVVYDSGNQRLVKLELEKAH